MTLKEQQVTSALLYILPSFFCRYSFANKLIACSRKKKLSKRQRTTNKMRGTRRMYSLKQRSERKREWHAIAEEKARELRNETGLLGGRKFPVDSQENGSRLRLHTSLLALASRSLAIQLDVAEDCRTESRIPMTTMRKQTKMGSCILAIKLSRPD
jgi:hypothetical protein